MKLDKLVFGVVIAMCAVVVALTLVPEGGGAVVHPEFSTMRHSGDGIDRHPLQLVVGWLFGVLMIVLFVALIAFGARQDERLRGLGRPLLYAGAAYVGVWSWLVVAYHEYLTEPLAPVFLGFPEPTAVMIYVLWPVSTVFNLYFVFGFRRWVLSDDDLAKYRRLVAERQAREGDDSGADHSAPGQET